MGTDARIAAVVAAVAGAPYLMGGFVWDDGPLIAERLVHLDMGGLLQLWAGPVSIEGPGAAYYRPVALTVMALLGRLGPWAIHLLALLSHATSAFLLVRLCRGTRWPLIAGLVFAVHPLTSEVLGWCSALPDALAVTLGLMAVWCRPRSTLAAFLLLVAGGLSKETALLIPLIFALGSHSRRSWMLPWLTAVAVVLAARLASGVSLGSAWLGKMGLAPEALGWATGALAWPFPLHAVRDLHVAPMSVVLLGVVLMALLFGLARRHSMAMAGAALVVAAPLLALPVALDGYLLAERYSYPALVGLGVWLAAIVPPLGRSWWLGLPVVLGLVGHVKQADRWRSNLDLFASAEVGGRGSSYAWHLLGVSQMGAGEHALAAASFLQAIEGGTPYPTDRFLRLKTLVLSGQPEVALTWMDAGPVDGLTAEEVAWRARAAWAAGDGPRAQALVSMLRRGDQFDGPFWVSGLAQTIFQGTEPPFNPGESSAP
jgi:hypothetical protein